MNRNGFRMPFTTIFRAFRSGDDASGFPLAAAPVAGFTRTIVPSSPVGSMFVPPVELPAAKWALTWAALSAVLYTATSSSVPLKGTPHVGAWFPIAAFVPEGTEAAEGIAPLARTPST